MRGGVVNGSPEGWECAPDCPIRLMNEQSGQKPPSYRKSRTTDPQGATWGLHRTDGASFGHHDAGGASRYFPNFSNNAEGHLDSEQSGKSQILVGDCREVMAEMPENSVDAIVTDPPYGLTFMGKGWDNLGHGNGQQAWHRLWANEAFRVLKPGGHMLAFSGTRTYHRMVCAIEDAGFEIRDSIHWVYGSGFPKSLDVSKQIDKINGKHLVDLSKFGEYIKEKRQAKGWSLRELDEQMGTNTAASWWEGRKSGVQLPSLQTYKHLKQVLDLDSRFDSLIEWAEAEREVVGRKVYAGPAGNDANFGVGEHSTNGNKRTLTAPSTEAAKQWEGWGTAIKPSHEPIVVARKPLSEKNVASNALKWGTGAVNVDGCRVGTEPAYKDRVFHKASGGLLNTNGEKGVTSGGAGRWPPNLLLSHSPECQPTGEVRRVKGARKPGLPEREFTSKGYKGGAWGQQDHSKHGPTGRMKPIYADPDGYEQVEEWICADGCPVAEMDRQSGRAGAHGDNGGPRSSMQPYGWGMSDKVERNQHNDKGGASRFFPRFPADTAEQQTQGRWPPNLLLSHSPECQPTGEVRRVKNEGYRANSSTANHDSRRTTYGSFGKHEWGARGYGDRDGTEAVEEWICVEGCPVLLMDRQSGQLKSGGGDKGNKTIGAQGYHSNVNQFSHEYKADSGGASRFFPRFPSEPPFRYQAKSSRAERNAGLEGMPEHHASVGNKEAAGRDGAKPGNALPGGARDRVERGLPPTMPRANGHPTVKPIALMRWLVRLVTPPNGTVLDPFCGSGSTGCAAVQEGFNFIGIEMDEEYAEIARRRIAYWSLPEEERPKGKGSKASPVKESERLEKPPEPPLETLF